MPDDEDRCSPRVGHRRLQNTVINIAGLLSQPWGWGVRELETDTSREVTGETERLRSKCWGESSEAMLQLGS